MGSLDAKGKIGVGELIGYVPVLPAAICVAFKHGFGRRAGWYFLIVMSLMHIVGSAIEIYAELNDPTNVTLLSVGFSLSSASLSALMLSTLAILRRLQSGLRNPLIRDKYFEFLGAPPLIGLLLVAYGASEAGSPDNESTGQTLLEAGHIVILLVIFGEGVLAVLTFRERQNIRKGDQNMLWAVLFSLPLVTRRILYGVLTAFNFNHQSSSPFSSTNPNIWTVIFMEKILEYIVAIAYLGAAAFAHRIRGKGAQTSHEELAVSREAPYPHRPQ